MTPNHDEPWCFCNAASRDLGTGAVGRGFFHSLSVYLPILLIMDGIVLDFQKKFTKRIFYSAVTYCFKKKEFFSGNCCKVGKTNSGISIISEAAPRTDEA
nr:MAG: hypothetical protein BECKFM1743B_GA0114221_100393 [Candidatus Kentron sp. FM]